MVNTVTIIIPFYNAYRTLRNAVFSVIGQSYYDWQLILLDDGSTDGSGDTVADLVDDKRIFLVSDGVNRGLIFRLNQMVDLTDAPYIARMDADDLMHPDRLRRQMGVVEADPQLDIVSTGMAVLDDDYRVRGVRNVAGQPAVEDFVRHGGLIHASCIFRREFLVANKYDPGFYRAEDREFFLRVIPAARYHRVNEPLYFCVEYDCFNKRKYLDAYRSERKAILKHGSRLLGRPLTAAFFLRSLLKSLAVWLMAAGGMGARLTRRNESLPADDFGDLQGMVDNILALSQGSAPADIA